MSGEEGSAARLDRPEVEPVFPVGWWATLGPQFGATQRVLNTFIVGASWYQTANWYHGTVEALDRGSSVRIVCQCLDSGTIPLAGYALTNGVESVSFTFPLSSCHAVPTYRTCYVYTSYPSESPSSLFALLLFRTVVSNPIQQVEALMYPLRTRSSVLHSRQWEDGN